MAKNDVTQRWPQVLPGGRAVLYSGHASTSVTTGTTQTSPYGRLDGGDAKVLVRGGFHARYVRSGHVLYIHSGTLVRDPVRSHAS